MKARIARGLLATDINLGDTRERLVDHQYQQSSGGISFGEVPSLQQP
jgi:hypothetical protein